MSRATSISTLVVDNYAAHKHPKIRAWLAEKTPLQPAFHADLFVMAQSGRTLVRSDNPTPDPARIALSVRKDLVAKIQVFVKAYNAKATPSSGPPQASKSSTRSNVYM